MVWNIVPEAKPLPPSSAGLKIAFGGINYDVVVEISAAPVEQPADAAGDHRRTGGNQGRGFDRATAVRLEGYDEGGPQRGSAGAGSVSGQAGGRAADQDAGRSSSAGPGDGRRGAGTVAGSGRDSAARRICCATRTPRCESRVARSLDRLGWQPENDAERTLHIVATGN